MGLTQRLCHTAPGKNIFEIDWNYMKWIVAVFLMFIACAGWSAEEPAPEPLAVLSGEVLEVLDVPNYTYLRLKTADADVWVAISTAPVKPGAKVTIENAELIDDFQSKSLNKTFEQIYFGNLPMVPLSDAEAKARIDSAHAAAARAKQEENSAIIKASGANGRTVAEIITSAAELKDSVVSVRGRVVKYSSAIMGKNWIHLRDGSGSTADASDDLMVTTRDQAEVGDVVLVNGIVHKDKDFGAGYAYKVLIEDAKLQK